VSRRPRQRAFVLPVAALLCAGCASSPAAAPGTAPKAATAARPRQDQQLIPRDVIRGTQHMNFHDVIRALRSNWLHVKATGGFSRADVLQVDLDNQRIGGVEELRRIVPSTVLSVRFFDPASAAARGGMDHGAGAIYVLTSNT
jgi:hypothetical protein